jgi:glycosyltransferase involved in cell wall biosynthesis
MISIDVIVPSYRLQSKYLVSILQMDIPVETAIRHLIIADNPQAEIPPDVKSLIDNKRILLFRNTENLGVCKTRNIGIDHSTADWVLFLDDDIKPSPNLLNTYVQAIKENEGEIGFFGDVVFPQPINSFTKGIALSGLLAFFSVPKTNSYRKWSPTANVLVKRSAIGNIRFNEIFAKAGAGEEIDFFLNIYQHTQQELKGIKNAEVYHDWWYKGKRIYTRFVRWNTGIAMLPGIFPLYAYYTLPSMAEILFLGLPLSLGASFIVHSFSPLFSLVIGILCGEILIEYIRLLFFKSFLQSRFVIEVVLIRAASDIGRLAGRLKCMRRVNVIFKRFDTSCGNKKHVKQQRLWSGLKFAAYITISVALYIKLR